MPCKQANCGCNDCSKNNTMNDNKQMPSGAITRDFKVVDDIGNPLPDVQFSKSVPYQTYGIVEDNSTNGNSIGITDSNGEITVTAFPYEVISVDHVSGETVQGNIVDLDNTITFKPNELDEVVISNEPRTAGLSIVGLLLLAGASKAFSTSKPMKLKI